MTTANVPHPKAHELPTPEWVIVTPDVAREMLTHNTHNRNVKSQHLQYAQDMLNGDWRPESCDPIRFAADGTLLDGQNRLRAVTIADVAIPFLVVRGLPIQTQSVMDSGVSRKFADVLKLNGEEHNIALAAVARLAWEWERGPSYLARGRVSNSQLLRFLAERPELREYATHRARAIADASRLPASIVGTLWWVFARIDAEDADYFFDRLGSDERHEKGDPIFELRRTLGNNADAASSPRGERNRVWMMAITVKAWNAYRAGETVGLYRWKPGGAHPERFSEPK